MAFYASDGAVHVRRASSGAPEMPRSQKNTKKKEQNRTANAIFPREVSRVSR